MSFPPKLSFWEIKQYFSDVDLLIVGSGIVGLTTAIFYRKYNPRAKVVVLEKGMLPAGASTKNAGFACFGSASEILSDLRTSSEDEVYGLVEERLYGLGELRALVGDKNLKYEACGGFELFTHEDASLFEQCMTFIQKANQEIEHRTGLKRTYSLADEKITALGFSGIQHLILNQHEGALNTGRMMAHLLQLASQLGVTILNGLEVLAYTDIGTKVEVELNIGFTIAANRLHIATNGFAAQLLPELDVKPARAQVLVTAPIKNLKVKGTYHMEEGFYYFRHVGNRILLGGGRQLDFQGETSTALETSGMIQHHLDHLLKNIILPGMDVTVEHRWAGIMGVGETKKVIDKHLSDNVTCSVRLGGMGVAIGTSIGKKAAAMIG